MKNGEIWPDSKGYDKDVYYIFDCSRINTPSLRYYTDRELVAHDENKLVPLNQKSEMPL